jgi:hypothetical protein
VELAGLGDDAGVVGAALLAMDRVDHQDPRSEFDRPAILGSSSEPEGR